MTFYFYTDNCSVQHSTPPPINLRLHNRHRRTTPIAFNGRALDRTSSFRMEVQLGLGDRPQVCQGVYILSRLDPRDPSVGGMLLAWRYWFLQSGMAYPTTVISPEGIPHYTLLPEWLFNLRLLVEATVHTFPPPVMQSEVHRNIASKHD
jgi:hypothetical protein